MRKITVILALAAWLAAGIPSADADPISIVVNGELDDWGVTFNLHTARYDLLAGDQHLWVPSSGVTYWVEDSVTGSSGYVEPGYGGQNYDVEAAYGIWQGGTFYGAFVTGFDQAGQSGWGGTPPYLTGDLFFDLNPDSDPGWDFAVAMSDHEDADGNEFGEGLAYAVTSSSILWTDLLEYGTSVPALLTGTPSELTDLTVVFEYLEGVAGEYAGAGSTGADGDHNVYELSIAGLTNVSSLRMHYTQECGNDLFDLDVVVPEPCTSLLALGALLTGVYVRRRRRHILHAAEEQTE